MFLHGFPVEVLSCYRGEESAPSNVINPLMPPRLLGPNLVPLLQEPVAGYFQLGMLILLQTQMPVRVSPGC